MATKFSKAVIMPAIVEISDDTNNVQVQVDMCYLTPQDRPEHTEMTVSSRSR